MMMMMMVMINNNKDSLPFSPFKPNGQFPRDQRALIQNE